MVTGRESRAVPGGGDPAPVPRFGSSLSPGSRATGPYGPGLGAELGICHRLGVDPCGGDLLLPAKGSAIASPPGRSARR
jgi:hypothetical protein